MRVISWNLKDIGQNKLATPLPPLIAAAGLGNNVLDYIVNVVMAEPNWAPYTGAARADLFIVIELVSGGHLKGADVSAGAVPTLNALVGAMNAIAVARGVTGTYQYASVPSKVTGKWESVGMIYNMRALTYAPLSARTLRDIDGNNLLPRTPFFASFNPVAGGPRLDVIGIHAPPPTSGVSRFRLPVLYTEYLARVPEVRQVGPFFVPQPLLLIAGDFNCDAAANFDMRRAGVWQQIDAFDDLINTWHCTTLMPIGSLSSMRKDLETAPPPIPADYLNEAYDNIFVKPAGVPLAAAQRVLDLIANARNTTQPPAAQAMYPAQTQLLFDNYWTVSDHMPVDITF